MAKLIKFFPLMPAPGETGKLIGAICFYMFVPSIVGFIVGAILGLTIILAPLAIVIGMLLGAYNIMGIVFAILSFTGKELK